MTQNRPTKERQTVAADVLRELGLTHEATAVEDFGTILDALLWSASFRHCCPGRPDESHSRTCRVAALLHRINPNFWILSEIERAHDEASRWHGRLWW